jgi:predicted alpha/beta-fold hydrolase
MNLNGSNNALLSVKRSLLSFEAFALVLLLLCCAATATAALIYERGKAFGAAMLVLYKSKQAATCRQYCRHTRSAMACCQWCMLKYMVHLLTLH